MAITNPQLASTAFVYWKSIPPQGIGRIEEVSLFIENVYTKAIVRVPLNTQAQVDKFVDLCFDIQLEWQRAQICQTWARQLERDNQVASALQYFEKGQSFVDIERICWNHFEQLLLTGMLIFATAKWSRRQ
jgi:Nup85 Nucleoporin